MDVTSDSAGLTYKRAQTAEERRRIGHEAAMLRQVAHPGIVQLIGTEGADPPDALVLRTVSGGDLTTLGPEPMPVIAGLGAAVATTVADLHVLGFCHGGIEARHVLLDEAGRPVLCSLSRSMATATAPDADRLRNEDLRALAVMLLQLAPPDGSGRLARMLRGLATGGRPHPRRDAAWLAGYLRSTVPDARLPGPGRAGASASGSASAAASTSEGDDRPHESGPRRRRRTVPPPRLVGVGVGFCILVAGALMLVDRDRNAPSAPATHGAASEPSGRGAASGLADRSAASDGSHAHTSGKARAPCPVVDKGCVPIPLHGGVMVGPAGRYAVGQLGDVVVIGRWGCGPTALPALLRPRSGDVWAFDSWATPDDPAVGRLVGRVPSAWSLRVVPGPSGCDGLEINRRNLPPMTIPAVAR
jgi:hypothetical protein